MAALSKRVEPEVAPRAPQTGALLRPAESVAGAAAMPFSPPAALQARIADAFAAPPSDSRLQIAGMGLTVLVATWLAGVMLYASL